MPQHKSAKKRMKTNERDRARNRSAKGTLKSSLKKFREMPENEQKEAYPKMQADLDKAARKGFIHPNKAGRLKSRLSG
jgi:small subunit ribosomal protein S20